MVNGSSGRDATGEQISSRRILPDQRLGGWRGEGCAGACSPGRGLRPFTAPPDLFGFISRHSPHNGHTLNKLPRTWFRNFFQNKSGIFRILFANWAKYLCIFIRTLFMNTIYFQDFFQNIKLYYKKLMKDFIKLLKI